MSMRHRFCYAEGVFLFAGRVIIISPCLVSVNFSQGQGVSAPNNRERNMDMALSKITDADLEGKGVCGQADVPGLSASEMQEKVEEIVRSVVIPKFNANADLTCTKEDLAEAQFTAGAVSSVFGRAGDVFAAAGDYDAAKIGYNGGTSGLSAGNVQAAVDELASGLAGKAASAHAHGNLSSDGKLGTTAGNIVVTGTGGAIEAKGAVAAGIATLDAGSKVTPLQTASDQTEITASHTLELADAGRDLVCTNSADITVTVPLYADVAFPLDTEIVIFHAGAGAVAVAFASGVTVWCKEASYGIADRYSGVLLKKRAADNTWSLEGNLG